MKKDVRRNAGRYHRPRVARVTGYPSSSVEGDNDDILNWISQARELLNLGGELSVEDLNEDYDIDWDERAGNRY